MSDITDDNADFDMDGALAEISDRLGFEPAETEDDGVQDAQQDDDGYDDETTDGTEGEDTQEQDSPETETTEQPASEAKPQPASWGKDKQELWNKLAPEAQEQVLLREQQVQEGFHKYSQALEQIKPYAEYGSALAQVIEPFRQDIAAQGVDEATAIYNMFQHHRALTTGTLEERQKALINIGVQTGLVPAENAPQQVVDPRVNQVMAKLAQMEQVEQHRAQAARQREIDAATAQLNQFAQENPHFDAVADEIFALFSAQPDKSMAKLKEIYDKAVWANPVTRAIEQQKLIQAQKSTAKQQAELAKRAKSAIINPAKSNSKAQQPQRSLREELEEAYDRHNGRQ